MTILFAVQVVLGLIFLMAGTMKVMMQDKARMRMTVLNNFSKKFVSFIGVSEIAGALGITLPVWLGIYAYLTPIAASGLGIIMVGAIALHLWRREFPFAILAAVFLYGLYHIVLGTM